MFQGTTKEFAALMKVEYAEAAGIIKFLTAQGIAQVIGKRETGRKPAVVYCVPQTLTITLPTSAVEEVKTEPIAAPEVKTEPSVTEVVEIKPSVDETVTLDMSGVQF